MAGRKRVWSKAHEVERLSQLIFDIRDATGRYMSECLKAAERYPADKEEWERAAYNAEEAKDEAVMQCEKLLRLGA